MKSSVLSKVPFVLLAVMTLALVAATLVEHRWGSEVAYIYVYHHLAFQLLWGAIVVGGLVLIIKRRLWQKPSALLLHLASLSFLAER